MIEIKDALKTASELISAAANDKKLHTFIEKSAEMLADNFAKGGKVICCGNGGSACDAMHFAEEFTGRYRKDRPALPAIAISDPGHITCVGNDYGFDEIFARGVEAFGKDNDILIAISTSGNSKNVINAVKKAESLNMKVIAFTGKTGGKLNGIADLQYIADGTTTDRIQEIHMMILHMIIEMVERKLFPENYQV